MKLKLNTFFLLAFLLVAGMAKSEVIIYKTYEDYQSNTGEKFDEYKSYIHVMGHVTLNFTRDGKKTSFKCKNIWGFKYNDKLFRTDKRYSLPVRVVSAGKICYYENGIAHLEMIRDNTNDGDFSIGYYAAVSADINSGIAEFTTGVFTGASNIKKFRKEHPEHDAFFECIGERYNYMKARKCVVEYEKKK